MLTTRVASKLAGICLFVAVSADGSTHTAATEPPTKARSFEEILISGGPEECRVALRGLLHRYHDKTDKMLAAATRTTVYREPDDASHRMLYALGEARAPQAIPLLLQRISLWRPLSWIYISVGDDQVLLTYPFAELLRGYGRAPTPAIFSLLSQAPADELGDTEVQLFAYLLTLAYGMGEEGKTIIAALIRRAEAQSGLPEDGKINLVRLRDAVDRVPKHGFPWEWDSSELFKRPPGKEFPAQGDRRAVEKAEQSLRHNPRPFEEVLAFGLADECYIASKFAIPASNDMIDALGKRQRTRQNTTAPWRPDAGDDEILLVLGEVRSREALPIIARRAGWQPPERVLRTNWSILWEQPFAQLLVEYGPDSIPAIFSVLAHAPVSGLADASIELYAEVVLRIYGTRAEDLDVVDALLRCAEARTSLSEDGRKNLSRLRVAIDRQAKEASDDAE